MGIWIKTHNGVSARVDIEQLLERLKAAYDSNNMEIMQLTIQSIIDELEE